MNYVERKLANAHPASTGKMKQFALRKRNLTLFSNELFIDIDFLAKLF